MNTYIQNLETIDLEEVIDLVKPQTIEDNLPQIESDDEVITAIVQETSLANSQLADAQLHHQVDPSYQ